MDEREIAASQLNDSAKQKLWEQKVLEKLLFMTIQEQRRARVWKIIFRLLWTLLVVVYVSWMLGFFSNYSEDLSSYKDEHIALIKIEGPIASDATANAENINKALTKAFKNDKVKALILQINSPGGSPVEADLVNKKITKLKAKYNKPIYSLAGNVCASAAYYMAVATDEIYANPASLVGSVGVVMGGFGFTELMKNIGIERRILTAGENKALADPFSPQNEEHIKHLRSMLDDIHQQFIAVVKSGRGEKLKLADAEAFSGLVWTGNQAVSLGVIDGLATLDDITDSIGADYKVHDYSVKENTFETLAKKLGAQTKAAVSSAFSSGVESYWK